MPLQIEYMIVKFDHQAKKARVSLKAEKILAIMHEKEMRDKAKCRALWRPEFASFMIEGTPGSPYGINPRNLFDDFDTVEAMGKMTITKI